MQHGDVVIARCADGLHGLGDFIQRAHAGGDYHRFAMTGDVAEQRQVRQLTRGDFEDGHPESGEKVRTLFIKGRGHEHDAQLLAVAVQFGEVFEREFEALEHVELAFGDTGVLRLILRLRGIGGDEMFGLKGLELHGIRAGLGCGFNELLREREVAIMIHARFGNDEARGVGGDFRRKGLAHALEEKVAASSGPGNVGDCARNPPDGNCG